MSISLADKVVIFCQKSLIAEFPVVFSPFQKRHLLSMGYSFGNIICHLLFMPFE